MDVISETVDHFPLHTEKEFPFNIAAGKSASAVLWEKIKRPNFVMSIWKYAHLSSRPNTFDPENNGWTLIDSNYYYVLSEI